MAAPFDLNRFIDRRQLSPYNYLIIGLSSLVMLFDGLDFAIVAFTAPYFGANLGLSMTQVGGAFSVGTAGLVVGGIVFGRLADRYGRRPMIIVAALGFSAFTWLTTFAQTYEQFLVLRALDGFAIGGVMPLCWALNAEWVSKDFKATAVTWTQVGYSVGTALAGPLTNIIAPAYGWQQVFLVASLGSALVVILALFLLPESIRFLAINHRDAELRRLIRKLDPAVILSDDTPIAYRAEHPGQPTSERPQPFVALFAGRLLVLTPLLCATYAASSISITFVSTWNPIILEGAGFTRLDAANTAVIANLAGAMLGLVLMRFTDRLGPITVTLFPAIAAPLLAMVGLVPMVAAPFLVMTVLAQSVIGGGHFGVTSIMSSFFPTRLRASGAAFTSSVGKGAAALCLLLGGAILEAGISPLRLFALLAVFPAVLAICAVGVAAVVRSEGGPKPRRRSKGNV